MDLKDPWSYIGYLCKRKISNQINPPLSLAFLLFLIFLGCLSFGRPAPKNEDEMMVAIFEYIDRIFAICRPRKLLYMAIDGVVGICITQYSMPIVKNR